MLPLILVVDDHRTTADLIRKYLERDGFRVCVAYDGHAALEAARAQPPDLVVLDLMLPRVDGLDVCHVLREQSPVPIVMVTARATEEDKIVGLRLGADDYLTKPFSPRELVARVQAVLRRAAPARERSREVRVGDLAIHFERREVRRGGVPVHLTPSEFDLLAVLARHPGRAFTRQELIERALGYEREVWERTVDAHVKNLRKKLEADPRQPRHIRTVLGYGYKLSGEAQRAEPAGDSVA